MSQSCSIRNIERKVAHDAMYYSSLSKTSLLEAVIFGNIAHVFSNGISSATTSIYLSAITRLGFVGFVDIIKMTSA